ncbi:hypothetical protein [uncultured Duncaniella sp.]|uniref:hypothetical protein n=1 Tax=uncultured Duncaniella sp. TaxID=2768039 RepID=UPI0025A94249|nr:hypothetical protein [uncultured Duncaniella sp.]
MKLTDTKYVIICGLMLLVCISIYARNVSVCGRVVDKYNGEPLIGACVYAAYTDKKDSLMAVADTAGLFTVSVSENQLLRFQYMGYKDTFALAKSNLLIELADGGNWKNPLWIIDSVIADVNYPDIWYQSPFGDITLESLVCEAMPVLREDDIEKVHLIDSTICFGNILYTGLCRVDTKPTTVQVIVDGENCGIITERAGRLAGETGAIKYASNILRIDSVVDAVAIDTKKLLLIPTEYYKKAEKMLVVTTDHHYPSVAESGFLPYQYDNGDDYVSDGRYRIVDSDGRIGYATANNAVIIPPRFAFGFPFHNGLARVTNSGHLETVIGSDGEYHYWVSNSWYWIDKMGNRLGMEDETER